jgi:hypothetical protein
MLIVTALYTEIYLFDRMIFVIVDKDRPNILLILVMIILVAILTSSLWILFLFMVGSLVRSCVTGRMLYFFNLIKRCNDFLVHSAASRLFGIVESTRITSDDNGEGEAEWTGRLAFLEKSVNRTVGKAKDDLAGEIHALEKRIYAHDELLQRDSRGDSM